MKDYQSLSPTKWDCKYHVVFIPKRRKKRIFGVLRRHLGALFHELAGQKKRRSLRVISWETPSTCVSASHPSMRFRMWWVISRVRARSRSRGSTVVAAAISAVRISGHRPNVSKLSRNALITVPVCNTNNSFSSSSLSLGHLQTVSRQSYPLQLDVYVYSAYSYISALPIRSPTKR